MVDWWRQVGRRHVQATTALPSIEPIITSRRHPVTFQTFRRRIIRDEKWLMKSNVLSFLVQLTFKLCFKFTRGLRLFKPFKRQQKWFPTINIKKGRKLEFQHEVRF